MAYDGSLTFNTSIDGSGFQSGLSKLGGAAKTGLKVAGVAIGTVTAGLAAAGAASIKLGSDFEAGMSRVKAISGATEDEFKKLNDQAKQLGADTSFSASQAAEGMENLASAGFSVEEITAAMPGLLDLAAASGEDLAASSEIAASAIRAFGLEADDAGHVADVLAANANMTNAAVVDTGYAFKYVAPIAKSLGISMEETAASIGILSNANIKGEQAGTVLRGAMTRLVNPTEEAADAADALGVSFFDASGTMKPLSTIIGDLQTATSGLSDEQKNAYLSTIFGTEALSGMLALIDAGPEQLTELTQAYETCDGAAADAAATMQDNLKGAIEGLSGSAESLGITIYESMAEPLKEAAKQGTDYVNQLTTAFQRGGFEGLIAEAGDIFAELATKAAENAPKMIDAAAGFINSFVNGIKDHSSELIAAAGNIAKTLANGLIKLLPKEIQTPLKKMVRDISRSLTGGGLQKAVQTIIKTFQNLIKTVSNITDKIMPAFTKAVDFLGEHLDIIIPIVVGLKTALVTYKVTMKAVEVATKIATKVQTAYRNAANLAAAAQSLLNGALKLSPIGLVTSALGFLVTGLLTYNTTAGDVEDTTESAGVEFEEMAEHLGSFEDEINNATGLLESFSESMLLPKDNRAELQEEMSALQGEITTIAEAGASNRGLLTDEEIQRLDELFGKMREVSEEELKYYQDVQQVVLDQAIVMQENGDLTEEAFADIVKSARTSRDDTLQYIKDWYMQESYLLRQRLDTDSSYTREAYDADIAALQDRKEELTDLTNETYSSTSKIALEGKNKELAIAKQHIREYDSVLAERSTLDENYLKKKQEIEDDLETSSKDRYDAEKEYTERLTRLNEEYNTKKGELDQKEQELRESHLKEYQASLIEQVAYTELYGGQIDEETWKMTQSILNNWGNLDEDSRAKVQETIQNWVNEVEAEEPGLLEQADKTTGGFLSSIMTALETGTPGVVADFEDLADSSADGYSNELNSEENQEKANSAATNMASEAGESAKKESERVFGAAAKAAADAWINNLRLPSPPNDEYGPWTWNTNFRSGSTTRSLRTLRSLPASTTRSLVAKMQNAVLAEQARTSAAILGAASYHTTMSTRSSSYSDNRRTSTVNIYQPVKSPAELERILRKTDKELANGF